MRQVVGCHFRLVSLLSIVLKCCDHIHLPCNFHSFFIPLFNNKEKKKMFFFFIYLPILSPMLHSFVHSLNQKDPLSS